VWARSSHQDTYDCLTPCTMNTTMPAYSGTVHSPFSTSIPLNFFVPQPSAQYPVRDTRYVTNQPQGDVSLNLHPGWWHSSAVPKPTSPATELGISYTRLSPLTPTDYPFSCQRVIFFQLMRWLPISDASFTRTRRVRSLGRRLSPTTTSIGALTSGRGKALLGGTRRPLSPVCATRSALP
jgi:hypothetical protein